MLLSLLMAVLAQASTGFGHIAGRVVDQQRLPVVGAEVALGCDGAVQSVATDRLGAFSFPARSVADVCQLTVRHQGFRSVTRAVSGTDDSLRIALEIDRVSDAVAVRARQQPFLATTLSERDFRTIGATTQQVLDYARALAGAATLPTAIYVDGLPSSALPPLHMIDRVEVNGNPFSAEFADGDMTMLRLFTRAPARSLRMNATGDFLSLGGQGALLPDAESDVDSWTLGARGPVPRLSVTFAANVSRSRSELASPVLAVIPEEPPEPSVTSVDTTTTTSLDVYLVRPQRRTTLSYRQGVSGRSNVGAGGLTLADATSSSTFGSHDLRGTFNLMASRIVLESGISVTASTAKTRANSSGQQVSVGGAFVTGGAATVARDTRRLQWSARGVVRSQFRRAWTAGAIVSGSRYEEDEEPNPLGFLYFESLEAYSAARAGVATGTLFLTRGNGAVRLPGTMVDPFVEMTVAQSASTQLDAGIRAEYQSGFGTRWSPRIWFAARWRSINLSAGGGVFPRSVPEFVRMRAATRDGHHLRHYLVPEATFGPESVLPASIPEIQSRFEAGFTRPRELVERVSASRAFGSSIGAVEFTWTQGRHLLGSSRVVDQGWVDLIESNRSLSRQRLHLQVQHGWRWSRLTGNYEWVRSHDNTDGPLSFSATPDLAAEWARSTGIPVHSATGIVSLNLPQGITVNVTDTWHGSTAFNITSARDANDTGLLVSRDGRSRNTGTAPGYNSLSLYAHRRLALPIPGDAAQRLGLSVAVYGDNLLSNSNYSQLGSVADSATFGQPLWAGPGRSLKVLFSID